MPSAWRAQSWGRGPGINFRGKLPQIVRILTAKGAKVEAGAESTKQYTINHAFGMEGAELGRRRGLNFRRVERILHNDS
jgi:hypothetical protein